jgi:hypothetical protein
VQAFAAYLAPLRKTEWVVYAKRPFGGPEAVLAYLSRYTHRVAIANSRLIAFDQQGVSFKWKDYRLEGRDRYQRMTARMGIPFDPSYNRVKVGLRRWFKGGQSGSSVGWRRYWLPTSLAIRASCIATKRLHTPS